MSVWRTMGMVLAVLAWNTALLAAGEKLPVVATTEMVGDLVRQVGGDRVEVTALMGPGIDPHLYKATSRDAGLLSRAGAVFYSGLMLEGRMGELFDQLSKRGRKVYAITDSVPKDRLLHPEGFNGHPDPHVWFDVELWGATIPTIVKGLSEADPTGAADYQRRGEELSEKMKALHQWCLDLARELPPEKRVLVTSHDAYSYFGRAYGFQVVGLQGVSTVSEAALADMASLVDFLKKHKVSAIFVESSVNPAAIRRVSEDAGVAVGGELFSDAMGAPGEMRLGFDTGTYDGVVRYNLTTIMNALKQSQ